MINYFIILLQRQQKKKGATALHEVLRLSDKKMIRGMVEKLMEVDAELARLPIANGTWPLYLAVSLGHNDIAELLYSKDKALSYSGPDGQNVLHVAVLRSQGLYNCCTFFAEYLCSVPSYIMHFLVPN